MNVSKFPSVFVLLFLIFSCSAQYDNSTDFVPDASIGQSTSFSKLFEEVKAGERATNELKNDLTEFRAQFESRMESTKSDAVLFFAFYSFGVICLIYFFFRFASWLQDRRNRKGLERSIKSIEENLIVMQKREEELIRRLEAISAALDGLEGRIPAPIVEKKASFIQRVIKKIFPGDEPKK